MSEWREDKVLDGVEPEREFYYPPNRIGRRDGEREITLVDLLKY